MIDLDDVVKVPKMDTDLSTLSLSELKALQNKVAKAIDSFEERRRKEALAAAEATVKEFGFSLSDIVSQTKKSSLARSPKYQHPEDPTQTWSGRGRKPQWFKDAEERGIPADALLIG